MIALGLVLAVLVGVTLGLLGGGGSILTVPILTYVMGMDAHTAVAASLFIVGTTSSVITIGHTRGGRVRWKVGFMFALGGMAGAFVGGIIGGWLPSTVLMIIFAFMMLAAAASMIRGREGGKGSSAPEESECSCLAMLGLGSLVGIVTGLVGAGGGFLIVPVLTLVAGLPMTAAVGTSLVVITLNSFAGLGGHLFTAEMDWPLVLAFTGVAIVGSFAGLFLSHKVSESNLRRGFGYFVAAMGLVVLATEVVALVK